MLLTHTTSDVAAVEPLRRRARTRDRCLDIAIDPFISLGLCGTVVVATRAWEATWRGALSCRYVLNIARDFDGAGNLLMDATDRLTALSISTTV